MRRTLAFICALAVMLGGCAGGDESANPTRTLEPQRTASSPSPKAVAKDSVACTLLTPSERRSIAGKNLDVVTPTPAAEGFDQCRWVASPSTPVALSVTAAPAKRWVLGLPLQIDETIRSGRADAKFTERLQAAKKKVLAGADKIDNAEACDMFALLIQANGGEKGVKEIVLLGQGIGGENAATAQKCTKGVYTLLTYSEPGLTYSGALYQAMLRLAKVAHQRAITRL